MDEKKRQALAVYREMLSELVKDCEDAIDEDEEDDLARGLAQVYNSHLISLQRLIGEYVSGFETIDMDDMDTDGAVRLIKVQTRQLIAAMRAAETLDAGADPFGLQAMISKKKGTTQASAAAGNAEAIMAVLRQVEKGEIAPDEAARRLDVIKRGRGDSHAEESPDSDQTEDSGEEDE